MRPEIACVVVCCGLLAGCRADRDATSAAEPASSQAGATTATTGSMTAQQRRQRAIELMADFAQRTGLGSGRAQERYLWTDAFAVCNFLGLAADTGEARYTEWALQLVDGVHHALGRHRGDDGRSGWLSGLGPEAGEQHPTVAGLRIGKPLPERTSGERFDERLEWERDGQYFHYLTQWMHALDQTARATGKPVFNAWARELADAAFRGFSAVPPGETRRRLRWKMSIDLSRPLVPSMGQHDPLDGYLVYTQLEATAAQSKAPVAGPRVGDQVAQLAKMFEGHELTTTDPLGIGGLLVDAFRLHQLEQQGAISDAGLLEDLLAAAGTGLSAYARSGELRLPAAQRLAFRELGLAIGLEGVTRMLAEAQGNSGRLAAGSPARARLDALDRYRPLADEIRSFWLDPAHRRASSWTEHRNINDVMLATSLAPAGFLVLSRAN